jgi:parallel beta-helix repeat protein/predicted outer membrane repeat protein
MTGVAITVLVFLLMACNTASAVEVSGDVWGVWTRDNSPYYVVGEIRIPLDSTLTIEPGVVVNFRGHYKFVIRSSARLHAVGTETDSIYFTADDTALGWHGLRFMYGNDRSKLKYCRIEYGKAIGTSPDNRGGGILCYYSSPRITDCTIRRNAAMHGGGINCQGSSAVIMRNMISDNEATGCASPHGGGIYCLHSDLHIKNNHITDNSAGDGGGIYCFSESNPIIEGNIVSENTCFSRGGGIYCEACSPIITNNVISGNSGYGGGIYCYYTDAAIDNNIVSENFSSQDGGGIHCYFARPVLHRNKIVGNVAVNNGGAIYCSLRSNVTLINNTVSRNMGCNGGGIYCHSESKVTVLNTILWADSADGGVGPEVYLSSSLAPCTLTVSYSDIDGGESSIHVEPGSQLFWEEGNLGADPLFVDLWSDDISLRWRSPCIDRADPDSSYHDPDGSRADIGAQFFNQNVPGLVEIYPHSSPLVVPPEGGDIVFDLWGFNLSDRLRCVDVWAHLFVPGFGRYGPLHRYENIPINPDDSLGANDFTEHVPGNAPEGGYTYVVYVGQHPNSVTDSSYFSFTKVGSIASGTDVWPFCASWLVGDLTQSDLPIKSALEQNYPNPFNHQTSIGYQLAAPAHVRLEVFNVVGQKVATLADREQRAGRWSINWRTSGLSSGVYFYKLTAGSFTAIKKMMLVK